MFSPNQLTPGVTARQKGTVMPDYETKVIGTSLGQCIKDILLKNVKIDDIVIIYANTAISNPEHLDIVVNKYCKDRWAGHNIKVCKEIVEYFLFRGMIQQERIGNGIVYGSYPDSNQIWYKFNELSDNFKRSLITVFQGNDITKGEYDLPVSDKENNINERNRLNNLINANCLLYHNLYFDVVNKEWKDK